MDGVVLPSRLAPRRGAPSERTGPDVGFLEGMFATSVEEGGAREAREAQVLATVEDTYDDISAELKRRGFAGDYRVRFLGATIGYNEQALWRDVDAARQRDASAFPALPRDADALRADATKRWAPQPGSYADVASRASGTASLIGGFMGAAGDPVNAATMGIVGVGASKSILQAAIREAGLNLRIEAVQQPSRVIERGLRGRDTTAGDVAMELGGAVIAGAAFGAAGKALEPVASAIGDRVATARETALEGVWPHLPEAIRQRWANAATVPDGALPGIADDVVGASNMSAAERAAAAVLRARGAIDAANPFVPNGAGTAAHENALAEALARALNNVPPSRAALRGGTALASGAVPTRASGSTIDRVFEALVAQESSGRAGIPGQPTPYGTAHGMTQVLDSTGRKVAERLGIAWRPELMRSATAEGAAYQRTIGRAYFEEGLARHGGDVRTALMFYHGGPNQRLWGPKTRAYADKVLARAGAGDVRIAAAAVDGAAPEMTAAQAALDRLNAERFTLDQATADASARGDAAIAASIEAAAPDATTIRPLADIDAPLVDPATTIERDPKALIPALRELASDRGRSLAQVERIATELGSDVDTVRAGLDALVAQGELRRNAKGQHSRIPREGPIDALKLIARNGGLHPDGIRGGAVPGGTAGHGLGRARIVGSKRRGGRDMERFIPGAGPLLRESGMGIDEAGELLWSRGYFGPSEAVDRPTEAEVLDLLERATNGGEKIYPFDHDPRPRNEADPEELALREAEIHSVARVRGLELSDAEMTAVDRLWREMGGPDADRALVDYISRELDAARFDGLSESDALEYDAFYDAFDRSSGGEDRAGGEGGAGFAVERGDAGAQRAGGAAGEGVADQQLGGLPVEAQEASVARFDDPDDLAAIEQVDSIAHDLDGTSEPESDAALRAIDADAAAADIVRKCL